MAGAGIRRIWLGGALVLLLAACGASVDALPRTLTIATPHGLYYTLEVAGSGKSACTTSTFRAAATGGHHAILDTAHVCGPGIVAGHPLLVQTPTSPESLLIDVPASGCGPVLARPKTGPAAPLVSRCSSGAPTFRVTILPQAGRVRLARVAGLPVVDFLRHVCKVGLCVTTLATR